MTPNVCAAIMLAAGVVVLLWVLTPQARPRAYWQGWPEHRVGGDE